MPYADYTYYTQSYHGRRIQEEETFLTYAERASEYMDMVTFDRLADGVPEEAAEKVQKCCCAVADALADYTDYGGSTPSSSGKTAETIGKYSVSYTTAAQTISGLLYGASAGLQDYLRSICIRYLGGTGLMYRGCETPQSAYGCQLPC